MTNLKRITNIYRVEQVDGACVFSVESPHGEVQTVEIPEFIECGMGIGTMATKDQNKVAATMFVINCVGKAEEDPDYSEKIEDAINRLAHSFSRLAGNKIQLTGTFLQSFIINGG